MGGTMVAVLARPGPGRIEAGTTTGHGVVEGLVVAIDGRGGTMMMMRIGGKDAIGTAAGLQEVTSQKAASLLSIHHAACGERIPMTADVRARHAPGPSLDP
jgi:hypothetical protein